ncbi:hypothetical protein IU494_09185 [Nocardia terpenica]|uniref:Uncharacterized protein n=1 Tax=Nocardia terpenica TaxID=455432 RepID=A0A164KKR9_9NOCA|nr:hypothetical protein [Nocardia terpenica]KZM71493.1 hypothetical protein AWN90_01715 [Nocardia terpenica]MBF6060953.1 hypothetical protein [Nocardia terpenica]MBF6111413.1 hypothetical protein [Nocardia terpenica]MBF6118434.1 hypothetical protein [Nocardia terpenica]MBF6155756.1 hypothetical protein [Nocardia terpenica]
MNGRTLARLAATAAALGVGAAATLGSTAAQPPSPPRSPLDLAIEKLTAAAGHDPAAQAGVSTVAKTAHLITAVKLDFIAGGFQPFWFTSPTFGCGDNGVTMTSVTGTAGAQGPDRGFQGSLGTVRFQATPAASGYPTGSGLTVAWLNTANGRSGVEPMDDQTDYHLPSLSKTVDSGPGTVVAAVWGSIDYPTGSCTMTPNVGVITVYPSPTRDPNAPTATLGVVPSPTDTPGSAPDGSGVAPGDAPSGPAVVPGGPPSGPGAVPAAGSDAPVPAPALVGPGGDTQPAG